MNTNPNTVTYCGTEWNVIRNEDGVLTLEQFRVDLSGEGAFCVATVRADELGR